MEKYEGYNARNYGVQGSDALGGLDDAVLLQRLILGLSGHVGHRMMLAVHLQDSRAFGWSLRNSQEPEAFRMGDKSGKNFYIMNPQEEFFEFHDAYLQILNPFPHAVLTFGRQKIFCADYRIFGPGDWGNTGRWTWDALRIHWQRNNLSADAWAGGTKTHDPQKISFPFFQTEFFGGGFYGSYKIKATSVDLFAAVKKPGSAEYIKNQSFARYWSGLRLDHSASQGAVYEVSYTKGFGDQAHKTINSYGLFAKAGWSIGSLAWRPVISARYSYASGDDPRTKALESFDPVYGAGDKYYGWMNLVQWSNLDDREIMLELFPNADARIEIKFNRFSAPHYATPVNGTLVIPSGKSRLGDEMDIFARYPIFKSLYCTLAFGWFIPHEARLINGGIPTQALWGAWQMEYRFSRRLNCF
ncbi:MAG TPA: alginate export family protein [bacterium]|nr:alginate export family protein [bacterium]